ncbi:MAG: hypothetical protein QM484_14500 [Woeseiaceae bacterium]
MKRSTYKPLYVLFFVVLILQISIALIIYSSFNSWPDRGTFGDMFGAVNTLFSGLAFAGVIYAILLQSKELELQREELKLTREELSKSASAQSDQVEIMKREAERNAISSELNALCQIVASSGMGSTTQIKSTEKRDQLMLLLEAQRNEKI